MNFVPSTQQFVTQTVTHVEEKIVETDTLEVRINAAKELAMASTTAKAQAAYDKVMQEEIKRIEDDVKSDYIAEIEATISDPSY
jgi:hypothetical protein